MSESDRAFSKDKLFLPLVGLTPSVAEFSYPVRHLSLVAEAVLS